MTRYAIVGGGGQLGQALAAQQPGHAVPLTRQQADLTANIADLTGGLLSVGPLAGVINCAAYTQVDKAETATADCQAVNAAGVEKLAEICQRQDWLLVQLSSDYVFNGTVDRNVPFIETDLPTPQGVYARSKLAGEQAARAAPRHLVIRTCGLYGKLRQPGHANFVETILRVAAQRPNLRVVADQHCTPSWVEDIAAAIWFLVLNEQALRAAGDWPNLLHIVNQGATTWHEVALRIVQLSGLETTVEPISTAEYGAPAPRPAYSVLDTGLYQQLVTKYGGPPLPTWDAALEQYWQTR
ncbi:MAG: dTDP-4-dehydrorhamnose reductase [Pirellulales bacterium]|nr:dTDP-4-dehydrorhamnose reductase [Pirellulales bacterium]